MVSPVRSQCTNTNVPSENATTNTKTDSEPKNFNACTQDDVRFVAQDRSDQRGDICGRELSIGIDADDDVGA